MNLLSLYSGFVTPCVLTAAGIPHLHNHRSPLITICPLVVSEGAGQPHPLLDTFGSDGNEEESTGLSFQLATLDQ